MGCVLNTVDVKAPKPGFAKTFKIIKQHAMSSFHLAFHDDNSRVQDVTG